ncbi:hypothetical protein [Terricaulis silvestris]|uniref:Uncharacterized protein n=1 Tax=Terricaulis silvestris TaxID=2686094 RepID=A0A6I6MMP9_9CAUL|nr:hypothetical protein [Terricaulis silvestris]QGZ95321.1 hypothetical protein DSM104635_02170 [Terricaulis silvestris]
MCAASFSTATGPCRQGQIAAVLPKTGDRVKIKPYVSEATNTFYNLMFCDDADLLAKHAKGVAPALKPLVDRFDEKKVRAIAESPETHPRYRALAGNQLAAAKRKSSPEVTVCGVVAEVPMEGGQDVFAVFTDGSIRYINSEGKVAFSDGIVPPLVAATSRVMKAAVLFAAKSGPRTTDRPAPSPGQARITCLVSDGSHVTHGPMEALMADTFAAPLLKACGELLKTFADLSLDQRVLLEMEREKQ